MLVTYEPKVYNLPFCKRLKEASLSAKLSQKRLGITDIMDEFSASARMNHYKHGSHTPDYSTLKRIAKVLKLPIAYFYAESDKLAEFIKLFSKLKNSDRMQVLDDLT